MNKLALAMTSVVLAIATIALWRDRESLLQRVTDLETQLAQVRAVAATASVARAQVKSAPTQSSSSPPVLAKAVPAEQPEANYLAHIDADPLAEERELLRNPRYREAELASRRLYHAQRRPELASVLKVSQAKVDALIDFWANRDIESTLRVPVIPTNDEESRALAESYAERERKENAALRSLLGDDGFARLREYQDGHPTRNQVTELRTRLAATSEPLRADQFEPLIDAIHAERSQLQRETQEYLDSEPAKAEGIYLSAESAQRITALNEAANRRIHAAAGMILSSPQLREFDEMQKRELALEDVNKAVAQARAELEP